MMDKSLRNSIVIGGFIAAALLTALTPEDTDTNTDQGSTTEVNNNNNGVASNSADELNSALDEILQKENQDLNQNEAKNDSVVVSSPIEGDPIEELNSLIGLESVKEEVTSLANFIQIQKQRESQGLKTASVSYHVVFTGNPGTGKTTVARILASIYKNLGIVKKGHLVETDRSGLIAEYVGQTPMKTNAVIDSALGGVLFIDEAYALLDGKGGYGDEAIATLLKRMEDDRDNLVVIVAGYTNEMKTFIDANPGLQSRFTRYINFPDYTSEELYKIFMRSINKYAYKLDPDAEKYIINNLDTTVKQKSRNFGNARYVRNLFEKTITNQANRLGGQKGLSLEQLSQITLEDIKEACQTVKK